MLTTVAKLRINRLFSNSVKGMTKKKKKKRKEKDETKIVLGQTLVRLEPVPTTSQNLL